MRRALWYYGVQAESSQCFIHLCESWVGYRAVQNGRLWNVRILICFRYERTFPFGWLKTKGVGGCPWGVVMYQTHDLKPQVRGGGGKKEEKVTGNGQIACFIINVGLMASFCYPSMTVMWLWSHFGH